ncbi:CpsD/CapB family tyrosine-protein kinase [Crassaminicella profunda]|uniref:CpsD/CapB family tyrosine-protein kinase n=1 Tax=Crassaminicella profunda TaxID=1286698 RepID=UPI001CA6A045|nr:CpsD/CapB family tyrosine-protein kinase [Crassaminicella profunda]QZY55324.1 CpsD/CapB family tyrosine-protein kinase [Crassaminicella profunda]
MKNLIALENPKSPIAEAYRTFRTNIQFSSFDKELNTIAITSTGLGEGKSTTIANLAITMAQSGSRVLLIDCDLRRPQVHKNFSLVNHRGLSNILAHQTSHEDVIKQTNVIGLDILTSGPKPPNPSELLGSNAMKEFIKEMTQKYDRVLLDAPPVGLVTDAAVLSTVADGIILVIAAGEVAIEAAQRAKDLLQQINANIIGVLLNKVSAQKSKYYQYYYQQYYDEEDTDTKSSKRKRRKK